VFSPVRETGRDDPAGRASPGVDGDQDVLFGLPDHLDASLAIILPRVVPFDRGTLENQGGVCEIEAALAQVRLALALVPLERHRHIRQ
jgi:hypothetical protein